MCSLTLGPTGFQPGGRRRRLTAGRVAELLQRGEGFRDLAGALDGAVSVSLYITEHIFVRPEFDIHYAPGLDNQFNSNLVPAGMVWVGYTFGDR